MTRRRADRANRAEAKAPARSDWMQRIWANPAAIGLVLVLVLAAALRFWGLGRQSLWWDEAYSVAWSKNSFGWILDLMVNRDYHPPEYYFLLHVWMQVFGSSDVAVRSLSALIGVAGVLAAYLLGRAMFRPGVGVLFAILVSVSEFHLYYSQEARSYGLLFATSVLAMHAYWRFFHGEGDRRWRLAYYIVAAVLVLYSHYTGVFVLAAQFIHRALTLTMKSERTEMKWWAASQAAIALLYLPWLLVLLKQAGRLQQGFWMKPLFEQNVPDFTVSGTLALFAGGGLAAWLLWLGIANGIAPTALGGINREKNPDDSDGHSAYPAEKILLLISWLLCSLLLPYFQSLLSEPIYVSRIIIPALAPFLLLAAVGIGRLRHPVIRLTAVLLVVALAVPGLADFYTTEAKEEWGQAIASIEAQAAPNATVLLSPGSAINPWSLYAKRADLHAVSWSTPDQVANQTAGARDVWVLSRQDPACNASGPVVAAARRDGRHEISCALFQAKGLTEFPLAANPLYVHHFTA